MTEPEKPLIKDRDRLPKQGFLRDSVQIYDERYLDWDVAWEQRFKRHKLFQFFNALPLITTNAYYSKSFYCAPYKEALIEIYIPNTVSTPTDILISAEFSDDGATWYKYMVDYWGDLRWEDVGAPYSECVKLPILAPYIRFKAISQGATTQAYFTLTLKAIFNN